MKFSQRGNVLVYVLMAVALLAALTYSISENSGGQQQNQMTAARAKLQASDMIKHAASAEMSAYQMTQWGSDFNDLRFDLPSTGPYTSNVSEQIYHPSGGGLSIFQTHNDHFDSNGTTGWVFQGNVNIAWSPSPATDLIYTFINVSDVLCSQLNNQLIGDPTIPTVTVDFTNTFTQSATDDDFIPSECAACESVKSLCISDGTTNAFYTIVGSR